eukprot:799646-Pleurochrysis_carterae.AAC.1
MSAARASRSVAYLDPSRVSSRRASRAAAYFDPPRVSIRRASRAVACPRAALRAMHLARLLSRFPSLHFRFASFLAPRADPRERRALLDGFDVGLGRERRWRPERAHPLPSRARREDGAPCRRRRQVAARHVPQPQVVLPRQPRAAARTDRA